MFDFKEIVYKIEDILAGKAEMPEEKITVRVFIKGMSGEYEGLEIEVLEERLRIGRDPKKCQIVMPKSEEQISAVHCSLVYDKIMKTLYIEDNNSTNGTYMEFENGESIKLEVGKTYILRDSSTFFMADRKNAFKVRIDVKREKIEGKYISASISNTAGREENEDCCGSVEQKNAACWAIGDGLGGHENGGLASKLAVEEIIKSFKNDSSYSAQMLGSHIAAAQNRLMQEKIENPEHENMRTTIAVLMTNYKTCIWSYLGDTRIYHFRNGKIKARTKDHSVAQALVDSGEIEEEEVRNHPDRNRLLKVLGKDEEITIQVSEEREVKKGDVFLLCSDGFWEYLSVREMEETLARALTPEEWLGKMEERILLKSERKGDNYSATAVFVPKR